MYTHCPHCDTYFRVTSEQLKRARGDVRCGRCFGTFNALHHLVDAPPGDSTPARPSAPKSSPAAQTTITKQTKKAVKPDKAQPSPAKETAPQAPPPKPRAESKQQEEEVAPTAASSTPDIKHDHSQQLIAELQTQAEQRGGGKRILWTLFSLPLALLLAAQYAYFNLEQLAQTAKLRPALIEMCKLAKCEVPLMRAPQQIRLTERDIRSHPDTKDILLVKATMVNEAGFTQAFPAIELVLHDITGHPIAGRRFLPKEYLVDPSLSLSRGFASNTSVTMVLELVDPGAEAVGFEFNFL